MKHTTIVYKQALAGMMLEFQSKMFQYIEELKKEPSEKKLREIEAHKYDAQQFIAELKQMVWQLVLQVKSDPYRPNAGQAAATPPTAPAPPSIQT
jgi:DNA topoisomerase IA